MDLYLILEVADTVSDKALNRAFRKQARKWHPEVNPGNEGAAIRYRQICLAHEILSDPLRREEYNRLGTLEYFKKHPQGREIDSPQKEAEFFSEVLREGFIGEILGIRRPAVVPERAERGEDNTLFVSLTFLEAVRGQERELEVTRKAYCDRCRGLGSDTGTHGERCPRCRGAGRIVERLGPLVSERECSACRGRGYLHARPCSACSGAGKVERRGTLRIRIPPGVATGSEIRYKGLGHAGPPGGSPGDLLIITKVEDHPNFVRKGDNLYSTVPLMVWEAALGSSVVVATIDGGQTLLVPPGTQADHRFRLAGRGVPNLKTGKRGDHFIDVRIVVPVPEGEPGRRAYRRLAELFPVEHLEGRMSPGEDGRGQGAAFMTETMKADIRKNIRDGGKV